MVTGCVLLTVRASNAASIGFAGYLLNRSDWRDAAADMH